jgi:hypothetical protein
MRFLKVGSISDSVMTERTLGKDWPAYPSGWVIPQWISTTEKVMFAPSHFLLDRLSRFSYR